MNDASDDSPETPLVIPLAECSTAKNDLVGGKAVGLGELISADFGVPDGFVVTAKAYRRAVRSSGLEDRIVEMLTQSDGDAAAHEATSRDLGKLFTTAVIDGHLHQLIAKKYEQLGRPPVAVRSSALAEDRSDASFAGQQDTYLWVQGLEAVLDRVASCWASLFSARVLGYRQRLALAPQDIAMAVVVQRMVPARAAGVMMTLNPVDGDRRTVYLESSYGLGEAVVSGEVTPDSFWIMKQDKTIARRFVGSKHLSHQYDEKAGRVVKSEVSPERQAASSLSDDEVERLAQLGLDVETAFGFPVDIEWAIDENDGTIALLQARPETVWSSKPAPPNDAEPGCGAASDALPPGADAIHVQRWDNLHSPSAAHIDWSTSNVAEAMPGVMTPLSWSLWHGVLEGASLDVAFQMGLFSRREATLTTDLNDHYFRSFFGRPALQARYFAMIGDRLPGANGEELVAAVLGRVPDDWVSAPTLRRLPFIAFRFPRVFFGGPKRIRNTQSMVNDWYPQHLRQVARATSAAEAAKLFDTAAEMFDAAVAMQVLSGLGVVIPVHSILEKLISVRGKGDLGKLSGFGGAEVTGLVTDVWRTSRGEITLDDLIARIGFHGPLEGEVSSTVWREDPEPLRALVEEYARQDDSGDPRLKEGVHRAAARSSAAELLAVTPALQRPFVRLLLRSAAKRIPLRGVAKRSLLQALDGARAAARKFGEFGVADGLFDSTDDVFFLTRAEVKHVPSDVRSLVARRRERRQLYEGMMLPRSWRGAPTPQSARQPVDTEVTPQREIDGIGVSAGVVEGVARVLHAPDFHAVKAGEILVTPTTDPSWSSVMLLSAALVVDIGGSLSHAAIVARELGVPCVVNTRIGTATIHTGDLLRVDGSTGLVQILETSLSQSDSPHHQVTTTTTG